MYVSSKCYLPFWLSYQNSLFFFVSYMRGTCPTNLTLFDLIILIFGEGYVQATDLLTCSFQQPTFTSPLLGPNISLHTLFSNIIILCSSLKMKDQVLRPYKTKGKVVIL